MPRVGSNGGLRSVGDGTIGRRSNSKNKFGQWSKLKSARNYVTTIFASINFRTPGDIWMDYCYIDYPSPRKNDYRYLSRTPGSLKCTSIIIMWLMHRNPREHRIFPFDLSTFERWAEKRKDYPHRLQFADVTIVVIYSPMAGSQMQ